MDYGLLDRPVSPLQLRPASSRSFQQQFDSLLARLADNENVLKDLQYQIKHGNRQEEAIVVALGKDHHDEVGTANASDRKSNALEKGARSRKCRNAQQPPERASRPSTSGARAVAKLTRDLARRHEELVSNCVELRTAQRKAAAMTSTAGSARRNFEAALDELAMVRRERDILVSELEQLQASRSNEVEAVLGAQLRNAVNATEQLRLDVLQLADVAKATETQLAKCGGELESVKQHLEELKQDKKELQHQADEQQQALKTADGRAKISAEQLAAAQKDCSGWQQKCLAVKRDHSRLEAVLAEREVTITALRKKLKKGKLTNEQLAQEQKQALGEELARLQEQHSDQVKQLSSANQQLRAMLSAAQADVLQLTESAGDRAKQLQEEVDRLRKQLSQVQSTNQELRESRDRIDSELQQAQAELNQSADLQSRWDAVQQDLARELEGANRGAQVWREEKERLMEEKTQLLDEVNQTVNHMASEREQWQQKLSAAEDKLSSLRAENEKLRRGNSELKEAEASNFRQLSDADRLRQELRENSTEQSLKAKLNVLQHQLSAANSERQQMAENLQGLRLSGADLRMSLQMLQRDCCWKEQQLDRINKERVHLQQLLTETETDLQGARAEVQLLTAKHQISAKDYSDRMTALSVSVQETKNQLQERVCKLQEELSSKSEDFQKECHQRRSAESLCKQLESALAEQKSAISSSEEAHRRECQELKQISKRARDSLQAVTREKADLNGSVTATQKELQRSKQRVQQLSAHLASLRGQLSVVKSAGQEPCRTCLKQKDLVCHLPVLQAEVAKVRQQLEEAVIEKCEQSQQLAKEAGQCQKFEDVCKVASSALLQCCNGQRGKDNVLDHVENPSDLLLLTVGIVQCEVRSLQAKISELARTSPTASLSIRAASNSQRRKASVPSCTADYKKMIKASREMLHRLTENCTDQQERFAAAVSGLEERLDKERRGLLHDGEVALSWRRKRGH